MTAHRDAADVLAAYQAGDLALGELPSFLMDILDEGNVAATVAALPAAAREFFLAWARENYLTDDRFVLGGEHAHRVPERALAAIRAYLVAEPSATS